MLAIQYTFGIPLLLLLLLFIFKPKWLTNTDLHSICILLMVTTIIHFFSTENFEYMMPVVFVVIALKIYTSTRK
jgi:hypothetical protein